jgi:hypothetical protein
MIKNSIFNPSFWHSEIQTLKQLNPLKPQLSNKLKITKNRQVLTHLQPNIPILHQNLNNLACSSNSQCAREKAYKVVAFAAVGFSLVAVLAVCVTMPIVYNFVVHVQQQTKHELDLCKVGGVWVGICFLI